MAFLSYIFLLINIYIVESRRVQGQRITQPITKSLDIYKVHKKIRVEAGNTASLHCCVSNNAESVWYKQPLGKQPRTVARMFKMTEPTFYNEFKNSRFHIEKSTNCSKMTIFNTVPSDEAVYYCGITTPYPVFEVGTYLITKGVHESTTASEISNPSPSDDSVTCRSTVNISSINMTAPEKTASKSSLDSTVFGLGMALGFFGILIFFLTCSIMRRRECENCKIEASKEAQSEVRPSHVLESHGEVLNYAALQFPKRKVQAGKRDTIMPAECIYSNV